MIELFNCSLNFFEIIICSSGEIADGEVRELLMLVFVVAKKNLLHQDFADEIVDDRAWLPAATMGEADADGEQHIGYEVEHEGYLDTAEQPEVALQVVCVVVAWSPRADRVQQTELHETSVPDSWCG